MEKRLNQINKTAIEKLSTIDNLKQLEEFRTEFFGKKGEFTLILKEMSSLEKDKRPIFGQMVNEIRQNIMQKFDSLKESFLKRQEEERLKAEQIDVTLPAKAIKIGCKHPLTTVLDEIKDIFLGLGYEIKEGPEIELAHYNFEALNIAKEHPARDEQDTFYINALSEIVLRTQTSPVQIRVMEEGKLPIKIIAPGRVYRMDEVDATHSPIFHQIEGLLIDKDINMSDLKGTLEIFAKEFFGQDTKVRFRPHYFPFTEPSAEMDISCFACKGEGCRICKHSGYIEVLGCGMVHPKVLSYAGLSPKQYSGFAFGMGLERLAMQKFAIPDLRLFFENDIKFLNQF